MDNYHHFSFITKLGEKKHCKPKCFIQALTDGVVRDFQWMVCLWGAHSLWPSFFKNFFDVAKVAIIHRKSEDCP
jgi:hypothetical protein